MSNLKLKIKTLFKKKPKVLFVVKRSQKAYSYNYSCDNYSNNSSGLFNSANFVSQMLNEHHVDSKLVDVIDGNAIDKEIHLFKPNIVIIEAFWVTGAKFQELMKLHPKIKFIVRNHSKSLFLAQEGIAFEWSVDYFKLGIQIACNSREMVSAYKIILNSLHLNHNLAFYLPNYYFNELEQK